MPELLLAWEHLSVSGIRSRQGEGGRWASRGSFPSVRPLSAPQPSPGQRLVDIDIAPPGVSGSRSARRIDMRGTLQSSPHGRPPSRSSRRSPRTQASQRSVVTLPAPRASRLRLCCLGRQGAAVPRGWLLASKLDELINRILVKKPLVSEGAPLRRGGGQHRLVSNAGHDRRSDGLV